MLKRLAGYCKLLWKLNITKTIYFNLKVFPFHIARKIPVYFFGAVQFPKLSGKVTIDGTVIKSGMVQFGSKEENIIASNEPTRILVEGELVLKGENVFAMATQLLVWVNGKLTIGRHSSIGSFSKIVAFRSILLGNNFLASWECQIFDTDFHFIEHIETGVIADANGSIIVGDNVWLGSRVTVLKNTQLPDNCIVALGSLCNKDYATNSPAGSLIGGVPAKLIKHGIRYINNKKLELKLFHHFQQPDQFGKFVIKSNFEKE